MEPTNQLTEEFISSRPTLVGYVTGILKSAKDAEDIVQETYIRMARSGRKEPVLYPQAYIFRIARNVTLDYLRRKKRKNAALSLISTVLSRSTETSNPEELLIADEQIRLLQAAILNLPKRCQQVYTLRKVYGLSHREIAEQLGISVRTVENHIASATMRCRQYLAEHSEPIDNDGLAK